MRPAFGTSLWKFRRQQAKFESRFAATLHGSTFWRPVEKGRFAGIKPNQQA
jgi:hypothetical protein